MSSWAEAIWTLKKLGTSVTGTLSTETSLSDAIDIIKQFDEITLLKIQPANENQS